MEFFELIPWNYFRRLKFSSFFNLWLRLKRTVSRRRWTWKHKAIEWQVSRQMLWAIPWRFVLLCAWARSFASLLIYACAYAFALTWSCVCKWWTINLSGEREWGDLGYFLRLVCCFFPSPLGCAFFYNGHNLCKNIFDIKITIVQSTCSMFSPWLPLYRIWKKNYSTPPPPPHLKKKTWLCPLEPFSESLGFIITEYNEKQFLHQCKKENNSA